MTAHRFIFRKMIKIINWINYNFKDFLSRLKNKNKTPLFRYTIDQRGLPTNILKHYAIFSYN